MMDDQERAAWLADKICSGGDYAKEAASMLYRWPLSASEPEAAIDVLTNYRCTHFYDEDGGLPLVDALAAAFGDSDIGRAREEIELIADALATQPASAAVALCNVDANDGFWRSCTGCHELNEGHSTGPYSSVFKCALGVGCRECGGLGAVWDDTDYNAMAEFQARSLATPTQPAPAPGAGKGEKL